MLDKNKTLIISSDGVGGVLSCAGQVAHYVRKSGNYTYLGVFCRDEIFKPLKHLLSDYHYLIQLNPEDENKALTDDNYISELAQKYQCENVYVGWPDLTFNNRYSFPYLDFNLSLQALKQTRILQHKFKPEKGNIYVNLFSTTPGYLYSHIPELVCNLANELKDYTFHVPIIKSWNNTSINIGEWPKHNLNNIKIYESSNFIEQIDILSTCEYGIYTDNGTSHIAYHMGQNYLLLDPRFGELPFQARWRPIGLENSIPIESSISQTMKVVIDNLRIPQSNLISKYSCLGTSDYKKELLIK